MDIEQTAIEGVVILTPKRFGDERGFFSEVWNAQRMADAGITLDWVQDNHSRSAKRGTVRGLHLQAPPSAQSKLVRVGKGSILDVAVDLREGSATLGQHVAVELSAGNWKQMLVPEGFAHGFCTLEDETEVLYKVAGGGYDPASERAIRFDDPALGIDWRVDPGEVTLSAKDEAAGRFEDCLGLFRM